VGTTLKTKCKVKVVLKDAKGVIRGSDVSDNYFTIEPLVSDLIETSVDNPPAAALPEGSFSVTDTAQNQGNANAGSSTTRYYLSVDKIKGTVDILLTGTTGTRSVPALGPGATSTGTVDVTIPSSTAAGAYYLLACADDMKVVAEGNETNNCIASSSTVQIQRPDLVETSVSKPTPTAIVGDSFSVTDTAKNQGNADAVSSTTQYYLSVDKIKGTGDILLTGTRSVPALAAGESSTDKVDVAIPSGLAAQAYYLLACADDKKVVAESNETNNCIASTTRVQVIP
jgi:subtilase family serine protease